MLDELAKEIHAMAREKGFWDHERIPSMNGDSIQNPSIYEEKIALMHTEAAEITEARRDANSEKEEEEVADLIIRALDYARARGFSMDRAVRLKMAKNHHRPRLHGRVR